MASLITMPKLSDTMEEGGIGSWLKKEGEHFEEGDPLLAIETDKATVEYASPYEGTLLKILVPEGQSAKLKQPIAVYGVKGESFDLNQLMKGSSSSSSNTHAKAEAAPKQDKKEASAEEKSVEHKAQGSRSSERIKASPLAKKMAKDAGVDLHFLKGSGTAGRIIARDVSEASSQSSSAPLRSRVQQGDKKVPHSQMRKTIAKRLLAAKNEAPHFYLTVSANMEKMLAWREDLNAGKDVREGRVPKVSINDLLLMVTSKALRQHPEVNASWQEDCIVQFGAVHICFAVALPSGLVTPVLFDSDSMGVREIAKRTKELGERAKKGELKPEEYTGGTFTISNLGMTKVEQFTAIINPPQACILAVGQTQRVPHVAEDGSIIAQHRVKMTLSCDHRVVDGMVGAKFLETLIAYLENPLTMLS